MDSGLLASLGPGMTGVQALSFDGMIRRIKKPPRDYRGGLVSAEGSSTNKTAAISGGRYARYGCTIIVEEVVRPWQAWQRPTLPSLET